MIEILTSGKELPKKAHQGDACADLVATSFRYTDKFIEYGTGLKMLPAEGYLGLVFPRSSISDYDLILSNSVGVIDEYTGEWKIRFKRVKQPLIESLYTLFSVKKDRLVEKSKHHETLKWWNPERVRIFNDIQKLKGDMSDIDKQIHALESSEKIYKVGDKIAQFLFIPKVDWTHQLADKMPETTRGAGGHGSTGK